MPSSRSVLAALASVATVVSAGALLAPASANTAGPGLVISEVYGAAAGRLAAAVFNADYVELNNPTRRRDQRRRRLHPLPVRDTARSPSPPCPDRQLPAHGHYLIQMGAGRGQPARRCRRRPPPDHLPDGSPPAGRSSCWDNSTPIPTATSGNMAGVARRDRRGWVPTRRRRSRPLRPTTPRPPRSPSNARRPALTPTSNVRRLQPSSGPVDAARTATRHGDSPRRRPRTPSPRSRARATRRRFERPAGDHPGVVDRGVPRGRLLRLRPADRRHRHRDRRDPRTPPTRSTSISPAVTVSRHIGDSLTVTCTSEPGRRGRALRADRAERRRPRTSWTTASPLGRADATGRWPTRRRTPAGRPTRAS